MEIVIAIARIYFVAKGADGGVLNFKSGRHVSPKLLVFEASTTWEPRYLNF
jgi:hypothetical protein